jgi:hypothetical protein
LIHNEGAHASGCILDKLSSTFFYSEGKILVTKFKLGGHFGMSLERDCYGVEVTPNLELEITFGMSLEGVCPEFYT